ncbi:MAG: RNA methyltransferase [Bacteroidales bacterium]|nr:RNA methyltransferase [Bacteroidales bacterium]
MIENLNNLDHKTQKELLDFLTPYITEHKKELFKKILNYRTKYITVVLEDIYQPQNASAVLRSADLTGIQDVHVIENKNEYQVNPKVAMGSSKWLNLIKYNSSENNTLDAYNKLREKGYRIVATTPHTNDQLPDQISLDNKIALVFGTELKGLSDIAIQNADEYLKIPMFGFTESYNISVSAALSMYILTERLRNSDIKWQLSDNERLEILLEWTRRSIRKVEVFENEFFLRKNSTTSF